VTQTRSPYKAQDEEKLMQELWAPAIADDPLAFVMFVFPWGKKGTPLEYESGPRSWQKKKLLDLKTHIAENNLRAINSLLYEIFQDATVSGRGVGKSALVAWIVLWFMSTRLGSTTIVTANNEAQLKTRTWAELGRWHTLAINGHWFERTAMSLKPVEWFEKALKYQLQIDTGYYYAQAQLWSEENPDGFAGVHNPNGVLVVFDEASGIPPAIWKVTKGFFTEEKCPHRYWFVFSNGRRNTGTFFECFHKSRKFWRRTQIDGRSVEGTDKKVYAEIIEEYGEDSDEARIEVKGEFPKQGEKQFISRGIVEEAATRELLNDEWAPLIMGVDIARYGDDDTVVRFRQGRNARILPPIKIHQQDNMAVANECALLIQKYNPDAVCIDAGNGTGVIDRLRELKYKVHEVWFGSASPKPEYANFRTCLWARIREWLPGACIDEDSDLMDDLSAPEYKFQGSTDKIRLETKEELKARGFPSPDNADALACTFAVNVARRDSRTAVGSQRKTRFARDMDYSIFG
jgi:hypothetical protein